MGSQTLLSSIRLKRRQLFDFLGLLPLQSVPSLLLVLGGRTVIFSGASSHPRRALLNVPVVRRCCPRYCSRASVLYCVALSL